MPRGIVFSKNEVFYEKTVNNLCSKQRIIYVEKTMNNFLNNAGQKIILNRMLETVNAENNKQFSLMQKTNFMNAISKFEYTVNMMCREQILLM